MKKLCLILALTFLIWPPYGGAHPVKYNKGEDLAHFYRKAMRHHKAARTNWQQTKKYRQWHRRQYRVIEHKLAALIQVRYSPTSAICAVFGAYCSQAIRVADCETGGTFSVYARNGQYLGLFQMGSHERATYGHSWTAIGQARAAYRYFVASGRDWSPWDCKP